MGHGTPAAHAAAIFVLVLCALMSETCFGHNSTHTGLKHNKFTVRSALCSIHTLCGFLVPDSGAVKQNRNPESEYCRVLKGAGGQSVMSVYQHTLVG